MIEQLNKIKYKIQDLQNTRQEYDLKIKSLVNDLNQENERLKAVLEQKQFYKKAIDIIYERSVEELKDILNSALSTIFFDRDFAVDIVLTDIRGKSLQLKATEHGQPVNLKRGTGMGEKTVISAVLQLYYLQCKNSKILMLDEAYSAVSEEYTEEFFNFLHQMCNQLGFKIILITHDKRFLPYADKRYIFNEGNVIVG